MKRQVLPARKRHAVLDTIEDVDWRIGLPLWAAMCVVVVALATLGCNEPRAQQPQPFVITPAGGGGGVTLSSLATGIPGNANGQTLAWNGTAWVVDSYADNPGLRASWVEDWWTVPTSCNPGGPWLGAVQGAGATCAQGFGEDAHPGLWACQVGTTTTGACRTVTTQGSFVFGGSIGQSCVENLVKVTALSTVGDEYSFQGGLAEPISFAESTDAVEWMYDRVNKGDFWTLKTCSNTTCTHTACDGTGGTTSKAVVANTWTKVKTCVNGAGTSATLTVDNTLCATNTTNIPTGQSRATGLGLRCQKSAGTTSVQCDVDYTWYTLPFGSAR
jgi:hypothetical protein